MQPEITLCRIRSLRGWAVVSKGQSSRGRVVIQINVIKINSITIGGPRVWQESKTGLQIRLNKISLMVGLGRTVLGIY